MAVMSKELAQICITCPIPFAYEDAKIENLYTPEAYQYMKRLNLNPFWPVLMCRIWAETRWRSILERGGSVWSRADFEKAKGAKQVGCQLILAENQVAGLAICIGEEEIYTIPAARFLTGNYLCDHLEELIAKRDPALGLVAVLDLKSQLPYLNLDYGSAVVDMGVAGYLLNPLKRYLRVR